MNYPFALCSSSFFKPERGSREHRPMSVNGRVEDGRGSLGPMANAPFPIPAHQTGRADFRHPTGFTARPTTGPLGAGVGGTERRVLDE